MKNEILISARQKAGLTKTEIARRIGVSLRMYQDYELKDCEPRVRTANKIAHILGTTSEKLWNIESNIV